ncbi:MAG: response regulator [Acidimicrobiia bacterium]
MSPIRVVIADDHQMMLDGLQTALDSLPDIDVVGTATDGSMLSTTVKHHNPDVLLVDVEMPGMSGLAAIKTITPLPPTLVVTMHTADEYARAAQEAGAVGFLSKGLPLPDLAAAIRAAHDRQILFDATTLDSVLERYRAPQLSRRAEAVTSRERDVLRCLVRGISSTDDIAEELYISHKTVKNHLASIYEKLGVNDRAQAVVEAMKLGLDRDWTEPQE